MSSKGPPNPTPREGERTIAIGGSAIGNAFGNGSTVINSGQVGETLTNCTNLIRGESIDGRRTLLEELQQEVRRLIEHLPPDKQDEAPRVAKELERLAEEATSEKPNRRWYSVSAEGLLEASKWVKDFGGNIGATLSNLGKSLWPDFTMPESK